MRGIARVVSPASCVVRRAWVSVVTGLHSWSRIARALSSRLSLLSLERVGVPRTCFRILNCYHSCVCDILRTRETDRVD